MVLNKNILYEALYALWCGLLIVVVLEWLFSFNIHPESDFNVFTYGAVLEEVVKGVVMLHLIRKGFSAWSTVGVGVGFGFCERLGLLRYGEGWILPWAGLIHVVAAVAFAFFARRYVQTRQRRELIFAFSSAVFIHAIYNLIIYVLAYYTP